MDQGVSIEVARDYLDILMAEFVMRSGSAAKTADVAREVGDLIGASARLVRSELTRSGRLLLVDRRWDLRTRHDRRARSVDGALAGVLRQSGKPLPLPQLAQELAAVRKRSRDELLGVVQALVRSRDTYFVTAGGEVGLREWLLDVQPGDSDEAVRLQNFFGAEMDFDAVLARFDLAPVRAAGTALDALAVLSEQAREPVACRLVQYILWHARGELDDPQGLLEAALADRRLVLLPGPAIAPATYLSEIRAVIAELSAQHDAQATGVDDVDVAEMLDVEPAEPEEFRLSNDDVAEIQRVIQENGQAMALPGLVSDVFELFPGDPQYTTAVRAVSEGLKADDRFVELPDNRWHLRVLLPPTLYRVPVTLQLSPVAVTTLTGELVDAQLTDPGLDGGLEWEVRAHDLEDIGEETEVRPLPDNVQLAKRQRYVTNYRHFVSGTVKIRRIDRGVFPTEPPIAPVKLIDRATGDEFTLWINNQTGLLCGLDEWYRGRLQPAGHVFHLERDDALDCWYADIDDEPDPTQFVVKPRLDELLEQRVKLEHAQDVSVLDVMRQLMEHHSAGVSFRRLYTECNIVRRVSKRVIASNLSSYPMFSLNDDETLWLYDERKANRPRSPQKTAFILAPGATAD
ncbi:MAG: hypothetical protein HYU66_28895 [Armatimonadetes bacterium]|nr:hypothetical protein [Armatimonadota bacterium]